MRVSPDLSTKLTKLSMIGESNVYNKSLNLTVNLLRFSGHKSLAKPEVKKCPGTTTRRKPDDTQRNSRSKRYNLATWITYKSKYVAKTKEE